MRSLVLVVEIAIFSLIAPQFFTVGNLFEVAAPERRTGAARRGADADPDHRRHRSLGRIDDGAVGGHLRRRASRLALPLPVAALVRCSPAAPAARSTRLLIARLRLPPLIVTLGSFSLFRGIAEGDHRRRGQLQRRFPHRFLVLGQGYIWRPHPGAAGDFRRRVRRLRGAAPSLGRRPRACTRSASARPARATPGFPSRGGSGSSTCCPGLIASVAAIVYVAHVGQAKSDAGTGYELDAITAVVLGGTSVFGGRGTLWGTALGLFSIAVLKNGLQLAALPAELTGVLTGVLLIATIAVDRLRRAPGRAAATDIRGGVHREEQPGRHSVRGDSCRRVDRRGDERLARATRCRRTPGRDGAAATPDRREGRSSR